MDNKNKCIWERYASWLEVLGGSDTYLCTLTTRVNPTTLTIPTDKCAYRYNKTMCPHFQKKERGIPMKYRKRPVTIEAVQWTGRNIEEIGRFTGNKAAFDLIFETVKIETLEGTMVASIGDYIINGVKGEYYPCKPDIFEQTYELVKE